MLEGEEINKQIVCFDSANGGNNHDGQMRCREEHIQTYASRRHKEQMKHQGREWAGLELCVAPVGKGVWWDDSDALKKDINSAQ